MDLGLLVLLYLYLYPMIGIEIEIGIEKVDEERGGFWKVGCDVGLGGGNGVLMGRRGLLGLCFCC